MGYSIPWATVFAHYRKVRLKPLVEITEEPAPEEIPALEEAPNPLVG